MSCKNCGQRGKKHWKTPTRWRLVYAISKKQKGSLSTELHRLELQLNRLNINQDNLAANLAEAYGEDWMQEVEADWALPAASAPRDFTAKTQLKALEPVNLQAIEDYQTLKERVDFLSQQLTDLNRARESLT